MLYVTLLMLRSARQASGDDVPCVRCRRIFFRNGDRALKRVWFTLLILPLLLPVSLSAQSLSIKALASPATVLPGLPTAFLLTITNISPESQILLDGVRLRVTRDGGDAFVARFAEKDEFNLPATARCASESCITLSPGASQTVYFNFGPTIDGNPFFMDERLSLAGTYNVQFELHVDHQSAGVESILSQPATFTVTSPADADAAFWQHMQEGTARQTWSAVDWMNVGKRLATEAYAHPTDTAYLPWLAGLVEGSPARKVAAYDVALSRNIPSALRDVLLYGKAVVLNGAGANAVWSDLNVDLAITEADTARAALTQLMKVTTVDVVRQQASDLLAQLLTPQSANTLLKSRIALAPPAPLAVQPQVVCVTRGTGNAFSAMFGYTNPNKTGKILLISNDNEVTPAPRDQGQPRYFLSGVHQTVFTASSPGGELKWHLDGSQATATSDFPAQCPVTP